MKIEELTPGQYIDWYGRRACVLRVDKRRGKAWLAFDNDARFAPIETAWIKQEHIDKMLSSRKDPANPEEVVGPAKRFWVRWFQVQHHEFEYHGPWWISGERIDGAPVICAAVAAKDAEAAKRIIADGYGNRRDAAQFDFAQECHGDWDPFSDRFPRRDWMKWPYPVQP